MKYFDVKRRKLINTIIPTLLLNFVTIAAGIDASIDYEVRGDGFHRTVQYHVDLGEFFQEKCHIALHFSPDPTLYVNVDELADLQRQGQRTTACSDGEIDVEVFAEKAKLQYITACAPLQEKDNFLTVPIHQRYRMAQENVEFVNITLPEPELLLGCKERIKEYEVSNIDLCSPCVDFSLKWRKIPYKAKTEKFVWMVPIGNLSHRNYVTNATLFVVCLGTIILLRAIWYSRDKKVQKID